jgi:hypothetical protein
VKRNVEKKNLFRREKFVHFVRLSAQKGSVTAPVLLHFALKQKFFGCDTSLP